MNILVINGPNLNILGKKDSSQYGSVTLPEIETKISEKARSLKVTDEFFGKAFADGIYLKPSLATPYLRELQEVVVLFSQKF